VYVLISNVTVMTMTSVDLSTPPPKQMMRLSSTHDLVPNKYNCYGNTSQEGLTCGISLELDRMR
jgi:hypothetical protein